MRIAFLLGLIVFSPMTAMCAAQETALSVVQGAWRVKKTSIDENPDYERGDIKLLITDKQLILIEVHEKNSIDDSACTYGLSDWKGRSGLYSVKLNVPSQHVETECWGVYDIPARTVGASFRLTRDAANTVQLGIEIAPKGLAEDVLKMTTGQMASVDAKQFVASFLSQDRFSCDAQSRKLLEKLVAE